MSEQRDVLDELRFWARDKAAGTLDADAVAARAFAEIEYLRMRVYRTDVRVFFSGENPEKPAGDPHTWVGPALVVGGGGGGGSGARHPSGTAVVGGGGGGGVSRGHTAVAHTRSTIAGRTEIIGACPSSPCPLCDQVA